MPGAYVVAAQTFDPGVIQMAPADAHDRCSLGAVRRIPALRPCGPAALRRWQRGVAVVNPPQPALPCGTSVEANRIEAICEAASALPCYVTETDEATEAIGQLVAGLLGDGVTLRTGLGKVPSGIPRVLRKPRRLRIHSGLISDGLMELAMSGALDEDCLYRTTIVAGSDASYAWLPQARGVGMLSTLENPGGVNLDTPCG